MKKERKNHKSNLCKIWKQWKDKIKLFKETNCKIEKKAKTNLFKNQNKWREAGIIPKKSKINKIR